MFNFTKNYLNGNVRLLLYYGDIDGVCNFLIGQKFSRQLGFNLKTPKQAWTVDKQIAGFKTEYDGGVTFTTIRGGGHYVKN
uniref:Serine carboxypeptidase n=1 Tax=Meloidogyne javanica TaxID=6303 RepID=A0A915LJU2_MELJA